MSQIVDGNVYRITFRNLDQSNSVNISITGDTYSPETIWTLAQCLIPCVKGIWFSEEDTVKVSGIEVIGSTSQISNPEE